MMDSPKHPVAPAEQPSPETRIATEDQLAYGRLARLSDWQAQALAVGITTLVVLGCTLLLIVMLPAR